MPSDIFTLAEVARALRQHPRSLCRALTGTDGSGWFASRRGVADLERIAKAFGTSERKLRQIVRGEIKLLTFNETATALGVTHWQLYRAVRIRRIVPTVRRDKHTCAPMRFDAAYIAALAKAGVVAGKVS